MAKRDFSISVDIKYVNIGAIVELIDNRGMMYRSVEGRDQFFREACSNPRTVPYGAALSHAKATYLGVWSSEESLYADCVKIMAAEFQRIEVEHDVELTITEDELRNLAIAAGIGSENIEIDDTSLGINLLLKIKK